MTLDLMISNRPMPQDLKIPLDRMLSCQFRRSDIPQLIVSLHANRVVSANARALALMDCETGDLEERVFTGFYADAFGDLNDFTEQVLNYGFAYSRKLPCPSSRVPELAVEHYGVLCREPQRDHIHISLFVLDEFHKRQVDNEADLYQRLGYQEWLRVERFFREVELRNQLILKAAGEGIYGVDLDGNTIFVNQAATEILGWSEDELIGKEMHSLVHYAYPDGSHYHGDDCPIYAAFRLGKVTQVEDEVFWNKNGKPIQVEYTSTPIVDGGETIGAVIVFRDVTQRRMREAQLKHALEENARLRERLEQENAYLHEEIRTHRHDTGIIGDSAAVQYIYQQVELVAPTDVSILVTGESGTGKELVAHAVHEASNRKDKPLIRVNCAAIPGELFESEFFGHARGAFTGALRDRVGRFELADGGTLFLDEVGEIPLELQSKLLRVLQDQKFERVGEDKTRSADVRLIAATNRNLRKEVEAGRFREDLYFRLNVFPIDCAPLRRRREDIPLLAAHFLGQAAKKLNIDPPILTVGNIARMTAYDWPGNVRELQNVIERAAILATKGRINLSLPEHKADCVDQEEAVLKPAAQPENEGDRKILTAEEVRDFERENIKLALQQCRGRVSGDFGAAAVLQMKPTTLYSKIKKFGL